MEKTQKSHRLRAGVAMSLLLAQPMAFAATGAQAGSCGDACLTIATALEPGSLFVIRDGDDGNTLVNWSINQPLVDRDAEGNLIPILAAELPRVDDADPTVWHVKLREGVRFTNGEAFDAETVRHNVALVTDPAFGASINGIETLKEVRVIDAHTLELVTNKPDPWLLYRISTLRFVPTEASKDIEGYAQHPIGTGPYAFVQWDKGQRIVLEKNDSYWGGDGAQLERVEFRFIPESATRIASLRSGEVDMVTSLSPDEVRRVPQVLTSADAANTTYLRVNLDAPPYDQLALRQALSMAINREVLNTYLWDSKAIIPQCQLLPKGEVGFNDSLVPTPYDPAKAKALLDTVTLPPDFKVEAIFTTGGYYPKDNEMGQAIAADWEAIGIKSNIQYVSGDRWLDDVLAGGPATSAKGPGPLTYLQLDYHSMYAARIAGRVYDRTNKMTATGQQGAQIDTLLATAQQSFDPAVAADAFAQINKIACEQVMVIPLLDFPDIWGATEAVKYQPGKGVIVRIHLDKIRVE